MLANQLAVRLFGVLCFGTSFFTLANLISGNELHKRMVILGVLTIIILFAEVMPKKIAALAFVLLMVYNFVLSYTVLRELDFQAMLIMLWFAVCSWCAHKVLPMRADEVK